MMKITPELIKKLDPQNVYGSVLALPKQIWHMWEQAKSFELPKEYRNVTNIVVAGMGGSTLGARMIKTLFFDRRKIPIEIVNNYELPGFVNSKTMVIASSYSGGTEEALAALKDSISRGAKTAVVTTGGEMEKIAKENNLPLMKINPKYNPAGQPRTAVGYSIVAQLAIFIKTGFINVTEIEIKNAVRKLDDIQDNLTVSGRNRRSMSLAENVLGRGIIMVASEHLFGPSWTLKNQLNESAKTFSTLFELPEMNHHLMEGLKFPASLGKNMMFLMIESDLYHHRIKMRYALTKKLIKKQGIGIDVFRLNGGTKLEQAFELLLVGGMMMFYLSIINQEDPAKIPYVDWFKKQLK